MDLSLIFLKFLVDIATIISQTNSNLGRNLYLQKIPQIIIFRTQTVYDTDSISGY